MPSWPSRPAPPPGLNTADACVGGGPYSTSAAGCVVTMVNFGTVVRYRIRADAAGVPVLQRWSSDDPGSFDTAGAPGVFEEVARGIEDLQIEYAVAGAPDTFIDGRRPRWRSRTRPLRSPPTTTRSS